MKLARTTCKVLSLLAVDSATLLPPPMRVPIQVVVTSDNDGDRRARVTPEQFVRWVDFANHAFRDAQVEFTFDAQQHMDDLRHTALNNMMGASDADWSTVKGVGDEVAAGHAGRLVVIVRHGPEAVGTGAGFGGIDHDFVVLGGFEDMNHCGHPHVDALAHEIGHYLGLPHTFVGEPFPDVAAAEAYLTAHDGDPATFDGDGFTDTLPDPLIRRLECERELQVELNGQAFVLPRRNLMSYYDERDSLSPQQVQRARWLLEHRQRHGMRLPRNRPEPGAREGEDALVVAVQRCATTVQSMDGFFPDRWSGNAHLFCGAERGASLTLELPVSKSGTYDLVLHATLAPDFGVLQCKVNDNSCGEPTDLYAPLVLPTGGVPLGRVRLAAGEHRISFEVEGKHADSSGYHFGIDAIELATIPR